MVVAAVIALTLSFTPDASRFSGTFLNQAPKKTLALPGLVGADITPEKTAFFTSHFATQLQKQGLQVTAAEDIAAAIGLERQKQLSGCAEDGSCMVEIASALGADGIITGKIAKLGDTYASNIKVIDAKTGKPIALFSETAPNEAAVLDMLTRAAKDLVDQLRKLSPNANKPPATAAFTTEPNALRRAGKNTMIGSGILLAVGFTSFVLAGPIPPGSVENFFFWAGLIEMFAVPGVFLVGLVLYLIGEDRVVPVKQALRRHTPFEDVAVAFAPSSGGGAAGIRFRF